jgi:type I restriction enzyme M protein
LVLKALIMNTQPFIECSSPEALTRIQLISLILDKPLKAHISQPLFDPAFKTSRFQLQTFENTLAIPRFGVKMSNKELATLRDPSQDVFKRFSHGDYNLRNEAPMLLHIQAQTTGRALVVIPMGMLFRSNDQQLRKEWLQKGQLEAVVKLPGSLFRTTNIATVLLIFNFKNTQPQSVYFLDAAQEPFTEKQKRKQSLTNLDKLIEHIAHRKEVPHQAKNVTVEALAQHNYELEPSLYILSQEEENMQEIMSSQEFTSLTASVEVLRSRSFTDSDTSETTYKEVRINTLPEAGFIPLTVSTEQLRTLNDSDSQTAQKQLLQAYDILLATRGRVGPVGIFPEGATNDWIAHQAFAVLRAKSQDHALALYLFLKSDIGQQQLHSLSAGSMTEQLPTKRLDEFKVPQFTEAQLAKSKALFAQEVALLEKIQQITQEMAQLRSSFLNQIAEGN